MHTLSSWWIHALVLLVIGPWTVAYGQSDGVAAEWDLSTELDTIARQSSQLGKMLEQVDPAAWLAKGAPDAYVSQRQMVIEQITGIEYLVGKLKDDPERLSATLELFFRLEYLSDKARSFSRGVGEYQNPALARLFDQLLDETDSQRDQVRQHLLALVSIKETELDVMNKEAQRCRETILRRPLAIRSPR